ncbi:MAG: hypothetical protein U5K29_12270 [Acidimicrobiales bacterium]|nr:hypothetical protein [Acidimicrobiales bacterium]
MTELFDLTFAAISWEPEIRGALAVLIGFTVLCGSVYLLLATNNGARTGLLLALTGLFGWCGIMGIVWTAYGIGWVGEEPQWSPLEVNFEDLAAAETDVVADDPALSEWEPIEEGTPDFGELQATTLEALTQQGSPPPFDSQDRIFIHEMYETGGKPEPDNDATIDRVTNRIATTLQLTHPPHYAVVFVQETIDPGPPVPGEPPPIPQPDEDAPMVALVLIRDLGNLRFTPAAFTFFSFVLFGILANALHRRDKLEAENRARAESAEVSA